MMPRIGLNCNARAQLLLQTAFEHVISPYVPRTRLLGCRHSFDRLACSAAAASRGIATSGAAAAALALASPSSAAAAALALASSSAPVAWAASLRSRVQQCHTHARRVTDAYPAAKPGLVFARQLRSQQTQEKEEMENGEETRCT